MNNKLFKTILSNVDRLDCNLLDSVQLYESRHYDITKLRNEIIKDFDIFDNYIINISKTSKGFNVDFSIYIDNNNVVNFDIDFFQGKLQYALFYYYNNIYVVDKYGSISDEISQKCMEMLQEWHI